MKRLAERLPFVKDQRDRVQRIIHRHPNDRGAQSSLPGVVRGFDSLIKAMEEAILKLSETVSPQLKPGASSGRKIYLRPSDIRGLPQELVKTLSLTESDFLDFQIIDIIEAVGGVMSLDHILIGLYRETKKVHDRIKTSQRIYRMSTKGKLFNVKGMKAVYTTRKELVDMDNHHPTDESKSENKNPDAVDD